MVLSRIPEYLGAPRGGRPQGAPPRIAHGARRGSSRLDSVGGGGGRAGVVRRGSRSVVVWTVLEPRWRLPAVVDSKPSTSLHESRKRQARVRAPEAEGVAHDRLDGRHFLRPARHTNHTTRQAVARGRRRAVRVIDATDKAARRWRCWRRSGAVPGFQRRRAHAHAHSHETIS